MKATVRMDKDVCTVISFLKTDIATIGIWDSSGLEFINSEEKYQNEFNKIYNQEVETLTNHILATETGGDGNFKVTINFNMELDNNQRKILYKSSEGLKFTTSGICGFGSPEYVGFAEENGMARNMIDTFEVAQGSYTVDAYSLLTRDEDGKPQFIEFVFCIWDQNKYPGDRNQLKSTGKILNLKYSEE